jgi:nitrogen regulatory protein PII
VTLDHLESSHWGKLIISIVELGVAEAVVALTKEAGAVGGTILLAKQDTDRRLIRALGLGHSEKEIILTLCDDQCVDEVWQQLSFFKKHKNHYYGQAMLVDIPTVISHTQSPLVFNSLKQDDSRRNTMDSPHTLITCIVNKGNAGEVMDVARKAGATGGTIVHGRGTGKEEDAKFFGFQLVPEKEILLMLVGSGLTGVVLEAIRTVPSLSQPGSGIAFCIDVERFMTLGGKLKVE